MVLGHLHRAGPSTPGTIAAAEHRQPQSLTRTFNDLERDGLILRTRSLEDRRASVLSLTPAGREALAADMAGRDAWLAGALAELTEAEVELLRIAGRLLDRLAQAP
jgi:DNA-binding MarR family transcriptional regulator